MSAMQMPEILGIHTGLEVVPCHEGDDWSDTSGWPSLNQMRRALIGTVRWPATWATNGAQIAVAAWLDHWRGSRAVWGLRFRSITPGVNPPIEGNVAYNAGGDSGGFRYGFAPLDGQPRLGNLNLTDPFKARHRYWMPNGLLTDMVPYFYGSPSDVPYGGGDPVPTFPQYRYDAAFASNFTRPDTFEVYGYTGGAGIGDLTEADLRGSMTGTLNNYSPKPDTTEDMYLI